MTTAPIASQSPIQNLAVELQRQLVTKRDLLADTRRVSLATWEPEGADDAAALEADEHPSDRGAAGKAYLRLLVDLPDGAEDFAVSRHAHGQIAEHTGVPFKFYDRLLGQHPDLLTPVVNGLLAREPSKRMLRTLDGRVRAFLSDRYRPRDNWDLMEALMPVLAEYSNVRFKRCDLTETRMYVKIVLGEMERQVKVGDVVRGGVIVSNSEVGAGALLVAPYTDRLICSNGQVHTDFGQRRYHVGRRHDEAGEGAEAWQLYSDRTLHLDDRAFFAKVQDTLRAALSEQVFDRIVEQMRELAEIHVDGDPVAAVEVLAQRHTFTEGEQASILQHLIEGHDLSAWGYVNAVTRAARDLDSPDRVTELETLAGRLTANPQEWVPTLTPHGGGTGARWSPQPQYADEPSSASEGLPVDAPVG